MSSDEHIEVEEAQLSQDFRSADVRSGDGTGGGRGGDIGSYNSVNSNNIVTHNTTIHIHSEEQLLSISRLPSQVSTSTSLSSRGSGSRLDINRGPSPAVKTLYVSRPHFIFNEEGQALDLSGADHKTVLSWPFHGGENQQWFLSDDGQGRMAFMCMRNRKYLAFKRLEEDAALFLSITPFYWEVSAHGEKFRVGIPKLPQGLPQANLALSIGFHVASLRPDFETHNTHLYILADTPEHRAEIEALENASRAGIFITTPPNVVHMEDDDPIDLHGRSQFVFNRQGKILDLSGGDNRSVITWDFHGSVNQQWAFERHSSGLVALKSLLYPVYVAFQSLTEDAGLFCTPHIVYWELSRDKDGYNLGVPGSHLGIGMVGETAKLRPLYADSFTRVQLLENSEAVVAEMRRGNFLKTVALYRGNRRPIMDAPRPSHLKPFTSTIGEPCFIAGFASTVLDLSYFDRRVYAFGYHGDTNQQWVIQTDGVGGATIQSSILPHYVKYHELQLDSKLALDPSPFTWEMIQDGDGYRFAIPGTNFALSLGPSARIRYLHEQPGTCVYLMDNSPRSNVALLRGNVSYSTVVPKPQEQPNIHTSGDSQVHSIPGHDEQSVMPPRTSEANLPPLPRHSSRPNSWKKSRNTEGRGSSSSRDCTMQ